MGLSPRVRGNRRATDVRINTDPTVYPRVCGGTRSPVSAICSQSGLSPRVQIPRVPICSQSGLSPRVRGNRFDCRNVDNMACYGLSPRVRGNHYISVNRSSQWVYPRTCGGTGQQIKHYLSPVYPRACGGTRRRRHRVGRSIPARAGEPYISVNRLIPMGLSPRVRGNRLYSRSH